MPGRLPANALHCPTLLGRQSEPHAGAQIKSKERNEAARYPLVKLVTILQEGLHQGTTLILITAGEKALYCASCTSFQSQTEAGGTCWLPSEGALQINGSKNYTMATERSLLPLPWFTRDYSKTGQGWGNRPKSCPRGGCFFSFRRVGSTRSSSRLSKKP